jgi:hypothetical protein
LPIAAARSGGIRHASNNIDARSAACDPAGSGPLRALLFFPASKNVPASFASYHGTPSDFYCTTENFCFLFPVSGPS